MSDYHLGEIESRFARLIWEREPLTSSELVKLAQQELNWKKSTTYTVLRRLIEKGLFRNEGGTVTSCLSWEEYASARSEHFVEEAFEGSLPLFLAAFSRRRRLTEGEIGEIQKLIEAQREGEA